MRGLTLIRRLYGACAASTNDIAHLDVAYPARILGVQWCVSQGNYTSGDYGFLELSFASVIQAAIHDAAGVISNLAWATYITTSGGGQVALNQFTGPMALDFPAGTRIYVHASFLAGTPSLKVNCNLHLVRSG